MSGAEAEAKKTSMSIKIFFGGNLVIFALGCAVAGLAAKGGATQELFEEGGLTASAVDIQLAGGIAVLLVGLLGMIGVWKREHKLARMIVYIYSILSFVFFLCLLIGAALALTFVGKLGSENEQVENLDANIQSFLTGQFNACCALGNGDGVCHIPQDALDASDPKIIDCDSSVLFDDTLRNLISENLKPLAGVAIVAAILLLTTTFTGCCVARDGRKKAKAKKEEEDAAAAVGAPARSAGTIAYQA